MESNLNLNDDFFIKLNTNAGYHTDIKRMNDFWGDLRQQTTEQIIQGFGIQELLNQLNLGGFAQYKDGGDFSTVHNAENGYFVDEEHKRRYREAYNRKNYEGRIYVDKNGNTNNTTLKKQRKECFKNNKYVYDAYTGKKLPKDGRMNIDHITSAKAIHDKDAARLYMTDNERNDMAVDKSNMAPTDERLNKSKGEQSFHVWESKTKRGSDISNKERYGIKDEKADPLVQKSEKNIDRTIKKFEAKELGGAALKSGITQLRRETMGVLIYIVTDIAVTELKQFGSKWKNFTNDSERLGAFKECISAIKTKVIMQSKNVIQNMKMLLGAAVTGFTSGVVGTLVSSIMNTLITLVSRWGKMIQDGISSFIKGFKLLVTNPNHLDHKTLFKSVIRVIAVGISATVGTIIGESIRATLVSTPFAPFADSLSIVSGAFITGVLSAMVIYTINNFGEIIKSFKNIWNDIQHGFSVSKEVILNTYSQALKKIDVAYREVLIEIKNQYVQLNKLDMLAHDINQLASSQLSASVDYARASGVSEGKILHNYSEISKYFME